jgi:hypothetical protein
MTVFKLQKRVAFITAGSGGIGLGMAKGFARRRCYRREKPNIGPLGVVGVAFTTSTASLSDIRIVERMTVFSGEVLEIRD